MLRKASRLQELSLSARSLRTLFSARFLSNVETKAALKPFYFAVHPDLFGRFPTQRAINEDSLKRLNSYIDNLENKYPVSPTHLLFYLKNEDRQEDHKPDEFKTVRISLFSRDLGFTVTQILKSCGMIEDFVAVDANATNAPYGGPLDWLQTYRQFGEKKGLHKFEEKPQITLNDFLNSHSAAAQEKHVVSQRNKDEIQRLSRAICDEFDLADLQMDCGWSCAACLGSLRNFYQLCVEKSREVRVLRSRPVVFTNWTGVDPRGKVMLSIEDVPQFWLAMLGTLEDYDVLVHQVPLWENRLSTALGGMGIVYRSTTPTTAVTEYLHYLYRVVMGLRRINYGRTGHAVSPGTYKDLHARILSPTGSLSLSSCGEVLIPASTPGDMLVDFLHKNKTSALNCQHENQRNISNEKQTVQKCTETLHLNSLSKEDSVSSPQMMACCEKLTRLPSDNLSGLRLVVSKYYHATDDGALCIPWDWK